MAQVKMGKQLLRAIRENPAYRRAGELMLSSVDGPQRDYYVGVRISIRRQPTHHGYRVCSLCGEPYLVAPNNHTRPLRSA